MGWRVPKVSVRQMMGAGLLTFGIGATALLAFLGSKTDPPSASTQALISVLAIGAQAGAARAFSGLGRADPGLALSAVRRLYQLAQNANAAKKDLQYLYEEQPPVAEMRNKMGALSVTASYLEEGFVEAIDDWRIFHPQIVEEVENRDKP